MDIQHNFRDHVTHIEKKNAKKWTTQTSLAAKSSKQALSFERQETNLALRLMR